MVRQNPMSNEKVTLEDRIDFAREALDAWKNASDTFDDDETSAIDLIADLGHLLTAYNIDFEKAIRLGVTHWQKERDALTSPQLGKRELGTILAALRHYQQSGYGDMNKLPEHLADIAVDGETNRVPLDDNEIDQLCERLNYS